MRSLVDLLILSLKPLVRCSAFFSQSGAPVRMISFACGLALLSSCADDEKNIYLLEEVRTPVLQYLQRDTATTPDAARRGCLELDSDADGTAERWCEQFPLRPEAEVLLRFVAISPEGGEMSLTVDSILQFSNLGTAQGSRVSAANETNSAAVDLTTFSYKEVPTLNKVLNEQSVRVQELYFSLTLPSVEDLFEGFQQSGALPGYTLRYTTKSTAHRDDAGAGTFFVLPDPDTSDVYDNAIANGGENINPQVVEELKSQAKTNTPPAISDIAVDATSLKKEEENEVSVTLEADPDEGSKARLQWYVSNGDFTAESAAKTKWLPKNTGPAVLFVVARDLQGGIDFSWTSVVVP